MNDTQQFDEDTTETQDKKLNTRGSSMGIVGVTTIVFVILKVLAIYPVTEWSWGIVLFGPLAVWIAFVLFCIWVLGALVSISR